MSFYGYADDYSMLSKEEILLRVTQEDIFEAATGVKPDLNKTYKSFVRQDNYGSCFFTVYNGKLYFVDFGYHETHIDCFSIFRELHGLNFKSTLEYINSHFELNLQGEGEPKPMIPAAKVKNENVRRTTTDIIFKPRPYTNHDIAIWEKNGIYRQDLLEDGVLAVLWYKFYSRRKNKDIIVRPKKPTFAYTEFNPRVKIYSPFEKKSNGKWIASVTKNDIGGMDILPSGGPKLVITKSYKDWRLLKNFGVLSVWFQNEGMIPDDGYLVNLSNRFDKIIVLFDNDKPGLKAAMRLVNEINSRFPGKAEFITVPIIREPVNITDPSDFYVNKGKYEFINLITSKNLL